VVLPALEGYPNRDSLLYEKVYGIEGAERVVRGTIRYVACSPWLLCCRKISDLHGRSAWLGGWRAASQCFDSLWNACGVR
jgi:hypothetical protein